MRGGNAGDDEMDSSDSRDTEQDGQQPEEGADGADIAQDAECAEARQETLSPEQQRICELELALAEKQTEVSALGEKLLHVVTAYRGMETEYKAAKERLERDRARVLDREKARLAKGFLDPLDNLERSLKAGAESPAGQEALLAGIELTIAQFRKNLEELGLLRLDPVGHPFDPNLHEAMAVKEVTDPALDGKVLEVWQCGYTIGEFLVRPARVLLGKVAEQGRVSNPPLQ